MIPVKIIQEIGRPGDPGYFATVRKHDIHCGIDLYCEENAPVFAIEDGVVVTVEKFTGEHSDSPWWNNTFAVLIEGESGVIVYGEIEPSCNISVGKIIKKHELIGSVLKVLKKDKGVTPTSMLHLELYSKGFRKTNWWKIGDPIPLGLQDPYPLIKHLKADI